MLTYGRSPVGGSADLNRVVGIPRRDLETAHRAGALARLEHELRRDDPKCVCASQGRRCPTSLKRIQGQALLEARDANGLFAPIGVGHGKTLVDLLLPMVVRDCRVAVLLIPANLRDQLLERDVPYYGGHWNLPNLVPGQFFVSGRPSLHVITYSKLQQMDSSALLDLIGPDLIICDEAHNLKSVKGPRVTRFRQYFEKRPDARLCALSGTIAARSILDAAHLSAFALGNESPYPKDHRSTEEWAAAIDPCQCEALKEPRVQCRCRAHPGVLGERLCRPGEHIRDGFRRRRNETRGVVATSESAIQQTLIIRPQTLPVPPKLLELIDRAHGGERPDGDRFQEQLQAMACARQLSSGFYHRWRYPRGEPAELITEWFAKRKAFNSEVWDRLKRPDEHLDSPGLLVRAAERWHSGYTHRTGHQHIGECYEYGYDEAGEPLATLICDREESGDSVEIPPHTRRGPLPVWESLNWPMWRDIRDQVQPVPEAVWESDLVVDHAAAWAKKNTGIVWVEFPELGHRIAQRAGVPFYGGGNEASAQIVAETGKRSVVASIRAHGTGKNLQSDGATWEQMIARTHRPGQLADEVTVDVLQHTDDLRAAMAKAIEFARFIQATDGQPQKLLFAAWA
jgi:hypothetical protein